MKKRVHLPVSPLLNQVFYFSRSFALVRLRSRGPSGGPRRSRDCPRRAPGRLSERPRYPEPFWIKTVWRSLCSPVRSASQAEVSESVCLLRTRQVFKFICPDFKPTTKTDDQAIIDLSRSQTDDRSMLQIDCTPAGNQSKGFMSIHNLYWHKAPE